MEYIITEHTEQFGWCLFKVCRGDKAFAEKCLREEQLANPDKRLRLEEVESKDCWWNDPFLSN